MMTFIGASTATSQALIAIALTGLAILVSFSDRDFLLYYFKKGNYDALLFIFEYTVTLAVLSTVFGIWLQTTGVDKTKFFIYLFIFLHLMFTILALITTILSFAEFKARHDAISDFDSDEVPDELTEDLAEIFKKGDSGKSQDEEE